jgi:hypothetical protein
MLIAACDALNEEVGCGATRDPRPHIEEVFGARISLVYLLLLAVLLPDFSLPNLSRSFGLSRKNSCHDISVEVYRCRSDGFKFVLKSIPWICPNTYEGIARELEMLTHLDEIQTLSELRRGIVNVVHCQICRKSAVVVDPDCQMDCSCGCCHGNSLSAQTEIRLD